MNKFSFKKGFNQIPLGQAQKVRGELADALGVNNRNSFLNYLNGKTEPKVSQVEAVEAVFNQYGITDIWGE